MLHLINACRKYTKFQIVCQVFCCIFYMLYYITLYYLHYLHFNFQLSTFNYSFGRGGVWSLAPLTAIRTEAKMLINGIMAPLEFGSLIHECLRLWHANRDIDKVVAHIDSSFAERIPSPEMHYRRQLAIAMMNGYTRRYPSEQFEVIALEHQFRGEIVNPATGANSRSFILAGKIDGLVLMDGEHYLARTQDRQHP